jgi:hypothetical protein
MHARGRQAPCPVTFVTARLNLRVYGKVINFVGAPNYFHRRCLAKCGTRGLAPAFWPGELKILGRRDAAYSPGVWTCAALYVAIGLLGIFVLSRPGIATSSDGYGVAAIAAPTQLR